ncbi:MAG: hypothetical protein ACU84Q_00975 [Gammaproteobacteria bacterium]
MENVLDKIDGTVLIAALAGLGIGWLFCWLFKRAQLRQFVTSTNAEIDAKTAQIDALKHDLQRRDDTLQEQTARLSTISSKTLTLEGQLESRNKDFQDLSTKIELLETSQSESSDEIDTLEDTIASLEEKLNEQQGAHRAEIEELEKTKQQSTEKLEAEFAGLTARSQAQATELAEITSQWETAQDSLARLEQLEAESQKIANPTRKVNQLQDRVAELTQSRQQLNGNISNLEASLAVWQQKASRANAALESAKKKITTLEQTLKETTGSNPSYERLLAIKEKEIIEQKQRARETQSKMLAIKEEIGSRDEQILALNEAVEKLHAENRRELAALKSKLEKQQLQHTESIEEYQINAAKLTKENEKLRVEQNNLNRQLQESRVAADALRQQGITLTSEISAQKLRATKLEDDYASIARTHERANDELARVQSHNQELRHRLEQSLREIQAKSHANENLRVTLDKQREVTKDLEQKLSELSVSGETTQHDANVPQGLFQAKPDHVDDLKLIKGVGPKLEAVLNNLGIYQFGQIAEFNAEDIAWVDEHIENFKGRIYRDEWVVQAKKLLA